MFSPAHHNYLSFDKMFSKKNKIIDKMQFLRCLPTCFGTIIAIVGFYQWLNFEKNLYLTFIGAGINILYWVYDLITLGKQVDRWNEKHYSDF